MKTNFDIQKTVHNSRIISAMRVFRYVHCLGLTVCALLMGSLHVWGAKTGTLTMSSSQTSPVTNNDVTFTWSSSSVVTGTGCGFKSSANMTVTIPSNYKVTNISKVNSGSTWGDGAKISVYAGSDNTGTKIADIVTGTDSYSISSNNTGTTYYVANSSGKNAWINSLSFTIQSTTPKTVTFSATSGTSAESSLTEASGGAGVTLPNVTPTSAVTDAGWGFYGWATASVGTETTTAPTIVGKAGDTYYPDENITLYAVYAKGEYSKITSTSDLNATDKYFFASIYSSKNYIMTSEFADSKLGAKQINESSSGKYHAALINASWCYTLEANSTYWHIKDCNSNNTYHYLDTYYAQWYGHSKDNDDPYTFTYSTDHWEVQNKYSSGNRYFGYSSGDGAFIRYESTAQPLQIYKETTTPKYVSAPCLNIVTLSKGTETNAIISSFSESGVQTCSSTDANRQVTVTVAAATGYEFLSTARLTFAKTSGTATATYVSGPTGTGPYTWVYRFAKDDSGAGTFSVTSATAKTYTITLNGNGATTDGTANVIATYNSATLSSAITNPEKTHYMFQGWYSGSGGTGSLIIDANGVLQANVSSYTGAGGIWTKDGATTLYAKWTEHTYTNYRTRCCDPTELAFGSTYYTLTREDIQGSTTVWDTISITFSTSSSGTVTAVANGSSQTAWQFTGSGSWQSRATTGGSAASKDNHAVFKITDAANGKAIFCVKNNGGNTGQGTYRFGLTQAADGSYCESTVWCWADVTVRDKFVDAVNGNSTINRDGHGPGGEQMKTPAEADLTDVDECHETTRRLRGWIKETDLQTQYNDASKETGYLEDAANYNSSQIIAPYANITTSGCTWYAVWAEEVTP